MVKLGQKKYKLLHISENDFWDRLDSMTVGQNINPEISYTTPFYGYLNNIFGGRKVGNRFSVYLYRPYIRVFRTEILAKGIVSYDAPNDCLLIDCKYEIPAWSILMFFILGSFIMMPFYFISLIAGVIVSFICFVVYGIIILTNFDKVKHELDKQFRMIAKVEIIDKTKF